MCSNVTGRLRKKEISLLNDKKNNALLVVDASQAVAHVALDVSKTGCDFCFFTGHKIGALTGVGVLW